MSRYATPAARRPHLVTLEVSLVEEAHVELVALTAEGEEFAARVVALARRAQVLLARGLSPANVLDDLEVLGLRQGIRMTAAAAELRIHETRIHESCVDERIPGHGKAA